MAYAYAFKANNQRHQLPPIDWIQEVWPSMYVNIVLGQGRTTKIGQGGEKYTVLRARSAREKFPPPEQGTLRDPLQPFLGP